MEALEKEAMERSDVVDSASDGKEEEKGSLLQKIGRVMTQPPDAPDEEEDKKIIGLISELVEATSCVIVIIHIIKQ